MLTAMFICYCVIHMFTHMSEVIIMSDDCIDNEFEKQLGVWYEQIKTDPTTVSAECNLHNAMILRNMDANISCIRDMLAKKMELL